MNRTVMGMKIALLQMMVTADKETNLKRAEELVKKAAQGGADMAVLPEMFNCPYDNAYFREYAEPKGGETYIRRKNMPFMWSADRFRKSGIIKFTTQVILSIAKATKSTTTAKPIYSISRSRAGKFSENPIR